MATGCLGLLSGVAGDRTQRSTLGKASPARGGMICGLVMVRRTAGERWGGGVDRIAEPAYFLWNEGKRKGLCECSVSGCLRCGEQRSAHSRHLDHPSNQMPSQLPLLANAFLLPNNSSLHHHTHSASSYASCLQYTTRQRSVVNWKSICRPSVPSNINSPPSSPQNSQPCTTTPTSTRARHQVSSSSNHSSNRSTNSMPPIRLASTGTIHPPPRPTPAPTLLLLPPTTITQHPAAPPVALLHQKHTSAILVASVAPIG